MKIDLSGEPERIVREELKSGRFRTAEDVIGEALQALREREKQQSSRATASDGEQRNAVREMLAFVEKNRVRLEDVSVKELIHEGQAIW